MSHFSNHYSSKKMLNEISHNDIIEKLYYRYDTRNIEVIKTKLSSEMTTLLGIEAIIDDIGCDVREIVSIMDDHCHNFLNKEILKSIKAYVTKYNLNCHKKHF